MRIVGALRVKNEARWLGRVLDSIRPVCEAIFVFDDHSTDDTQEIARAGGANVISSPFDGLNEVRDKNYLLEHVGYSLNPDWVLCIDGDEELEARAVRILPELATNTAAASYSLRIAYLWDREDQVRIDGLYGRFTRPSFFRYQPGSKFASKSAKGFHCSNVPSVGVTGWQGLQTNVTLLHYGYLDRETRLAKFIWYNEQDPQNEAEDCYRHMVAGDLPEVPADIKTKHAGPLKLIPAAEFLP